MAALPAAPALGRASQENRCLVSSRPARTTSQDLYLRRKKEKKKRGREEGSKKQTNTPKLELGYNLNEGNCFKVVRSQVLLQREEPSFKVNLVFVYYSRLQIWFPERED